MLRFPFASAAAIVLHMANPATAQTPPWTGLTVNGLRLHYLDRGAADKPTLILVHKIEGHAHTFDHIVSEFTRDYRVIALDMRGHGDSAWSPEGAYLVEDHVKDLTAVIRELGLQRVTLWGNSTGGRVVQVYAGLNPGNVERVISEDVGPERPQNISDNFAQACRTGGERMGVGGRTPRGAYQAVAAHPRSDSSQPCALRAPSAVTTDVSSGNATQTS